MEITFATKGLMKQLSEEKVMVKTFGTIRAKKLKIVLTQLKAAPSLGVFAPPMSPPHRCHELSGDRKGQLTVDLGHPYRLFFVPNHNPLPERAEGGLDWKMVTSIVITEIEDPHG